MTNGHLPRVTQPPADQPHRTGTPGRFDSEGKEWHACDPYPTWYRWENGELFTNPEWFNPSKF